MTPKSKGKLLKNYLDHKININDQLDKYRTILDEKYGDPKVKITDD